MISVMEPKSCVCLGMLYSTRHDRMPGIVYCMPYVHREFENRVWARIVIT